MSSDLKSNLLILTLRHTHSHTLTMVQGGWGVMEPLPRVFDMLQYFEKILPSVESLCPFLQDEVYFMGGSTAGGL